MAIITNPVLSLTMGPNNKIQIWAGNPGDTIKVSEVRAHQFQVRKTASLVYETHDHFHVATEQNLEHQATWNWIAKWMERGLIEAGHMLPEMSKYWREVNDADSPCPECKRLVVVEKES